MPGVREPILHPTVLRDLRPTQVTVGMREVEAKRKA
ncbi:MAG: ParB-like protein [Janthinobacterium lividum]